MIRVSAPIPAAASACYAGSAVDATPLRARRGRSWISRRAIHSGLPDGRLLYDLSTGLDVAIRSVARARRLARASRLPDGPSFAVYALPEMVVPMRLTGTAPFTTSDRIIFVLGDFRGDIWRMDLEPDSRNAAANN